MRIPPRLPGAERQWMGDNAEAVSPDEEDHVARMQQSEIRGIALRQHPTPDSAHAPSRLRLLFQQETPPLLSPLHTPDVSLSLAPGVHGEMLQYENWPHFSRTVARMQQSKIRGIALRQRLTPDYAALHPGYTGYVYYAAQSASG